MNVSMDELRKLAFPAIVCLLLVAAGAGLIWHANRTLNDASRRLVAAHEERTQNRERLTRIAEEEREVNEKLAVYRQLKALNIIGEERRLEWADAMTRIRTSRELLDVRYRVERQKLLASVPGKPGSVDFRASTMKVDLALLHEEDLLHFLRDLTASGNAYYSVRRCILSRTGQAPTGTVIVPRLRAECEIELITIIDGASKS